MDFYVPQRCIAHQLEAAFTPDDGSLVLHFDYADGGGSDETMSAYLETISTRAASRSAPREISVQLVFDPRMQRLELIEVKPFAFEDVSIVSDVLADAERVYQQKQLNDGSLFAIRANLKLVQENLGQMAREIKKEMRKRSDA